MTCPHWRIRGTTLFLSNRFPFVTKQNWLVANEFTLASKQYPLVANEFTLASKQCELAPIKWLFRNFRA